MKVLILLFVFVALACAEITPRFPGTQPIVIDGSGTNSTVNVTAQIEIKQNIDLFTTDSPPLVIVYPANVPPVITQTQFTSDPTVVGGERDLIFTAESGLKGRVISCGVSQGTFNLAVGDSAKGLAVIQYDGVDGSAELNLNPGLGGVNLTVNHATGFAFNATSDLPTNFTLSVFSTGGGQGSVLKQVQGSVIVDSYLIPFTEFPSVDFTSVVAIQFSVEAFDNVDFALEALVTYGDVVFEPPSGQITGSVLPCDTDYYRLQTIDSVGPEDYLRISFTQTGEPSHNTSYGVFYIVASDYDDLQSELESNENIVNTLGELPGPDNYLYKCDQPRCDIEITCELEATTYYIAVAGSNAGVLLYGFSVSLSNVSIFEIFHNTPQPVFFDRRPTVPPTDHVFYYRHFAIQIPESSFSEGTYLVVNISNAEPAGLQLQLNYGGLAELPQDTGIINSTDYNSDGEQSDNCIFQYCINTTVTSNAPYYVHPVSSQPRIPCIAVPQIQYLTPTDYQLTCNLTVDPCQFLYGTWFASVLLPVRANATNVNDTTGYANYTITAYVVQPDVFVLQKNVTVKGSVYPELGTHYSVDVPAYDVRPGQTHLFVQISNVRNGLVTVYVHKGDGNVHNLAGGAEGCVPANVTCTTSAACNLVVEKCHFSAGTWYIGVYVTYDEATNEFEVIDYTRLPITYTIRANWLEDSAPVPIVAGVPVFSYIGEALYDFYVLDVPPTIDTWLFIELYVKASGACDTSVILSVLRGSLPGGECYNRPDFYCMTGDPRGLTYTTGPETNYVDEAIQRQSCNFMIQTCELEAGPLYFSVYGHHIDYALYGDNTYYQLPVEYTLYVDFDVALPVQSGVAYSESVFEHQYQHYYIRVDYLAEGSYLSVEACNIQHGIPQTLELYVNYNYLAGDCPCYEYLYNATGVQDPNVAPISPYPTPNFLPELNSIATCATIIVSPSDFRAGVWYIGVLGMNQDLYQYTTPIGYTLTVTVHDAPVINPLILGQSVATDVPQWNKTLEYVHFKLAAQPLPLQDLVFQLTYAQSCQYLGKHDNVRDSVVLFVNEGAVASDAGYNYKCEANVFTESYCTIVIPHCEWQGSDYFVAIRGNYDADFIGRVTLRANINEVHDVELTNGVPISDSIHQGLYKHYFLDVSGSKNEYLSVFFYSNNDQDLVSVYLNVDERAGDAPCFRNVASCIDDSCCTMQIENYLLTEGRYYVSVYGGADHFYNLPTEYTLTVSTLPVITVLSEGDPLTGSVEVGEIQHYLFEVTQISLGDFLTFEVEVGCSHGSIAAYYQFESLAGRIPGYLHQDSCYAEPDGTQWCEIRIPSCELVLGKYFFSVRGLDYTASNPPFYQTAIGYTLQVNVVTPLIVAPVVEVGRFPVNTLYNQLITNERYIHYQFPVTQVEDDADSGYHWIVEITNVKEGALHVFYQPGYPGDYDAECHLAEICTSGLSAGHDCFWQIPYSTVRILPDDALHYISVQGVTGRVIASYDILIWKQPVPSIVANPAFTLDNKNSSGQFPFGAEVNVTHYAIDEPNGWTQFIKLTNVSAHTDPGQLLQVFFYRITNNIDEPMAFNVYLYPHVPAGAHECCEEDPGSCQGQPTQRTVDVTTAVNNQNSIKTHTCDLPYGSGPDVTGLNPFYGDRCTVTVWPCEFSRYCKDESIDWWLAVVPIAPSASAGPLPGLQYSVQWRTYDIRLNETLSVGTTSLDKFVNTYDFTPEFTVYSSTTENEGWRSFSVSAPTSTARIAIQTKFVHGSGIVYINGDNDVFPSPPEDSYCSEYSCSSGGECDGYNKWASSFCEYGLLNTYFITVRNTGGPNTFTIVSFRITVVYEPTVVQIPSRPSESNPYVSKGGFSTLLNTTGVEGENYNFYVLDIDDNDLAHHESLVVDLQMTNYTNNGTLYVLMREGAIAGARFPRRDMEGNNYEEGCYSYQYFCGVSVLPGDTRCILQIPHTQLVQGHYYISVYNPDFDYGPGPSIALPNYNLTVFFQLPIPLTLNSTYSVRNTSISYKYPNTYTHFSLNVTQTDIQYDPRTDLQGYYTNWLRIEVTGLNNATRGLHSNITSNSTVNTNSTIIINNSTFDYLDLYVNYDNLAGNGYLDYDQSSLEYIKSATNCSGNGCYIDIFPCDSTFYLRSGLYFISLYLDAPTTYNVTAYILSDLYSSITPETVQGVGNREGTTNIVWRHQATQAELLANGDNFGNYRYVVDTNADVPDDDVIDSDYFLVNISTEVNSTRNGTVDLWVWRDDCSTFVCSTSYNTTKYCVIDALTLAPCSIKGGRFYFRVYNPSAENFTLTFYQNETTIQTLLDQQVITEIVYPYEYQEYFYEAVEVSQGATLTVEVCSICGDIEAWIRPDLPAGPSPDATGVPDSCSIDHCTISFTDDSFESPTCCVLFLDTCQYEQRGYYIAVRGVSTNFPSVVNPHLYLPATYQIQAYQTNVQFNEASFSCPQYVTYQQRPSQIPQQFAYDLESANLGAELRFSMALPYQYVPDDFSYATLTVSFDRPVGYSTGCANEPYTCTVASFYGPYACSFVIPACAVSTGRYYVWADAPRGTEVVVERWDPVIPIIQENMIYTATINAPSTSQDEIEFPFSSSYQYYRFDYGTNDDDSGDDDDNTFYDKFFIRVRVQNVQHGTLSASINTGNYPYVGSECDFPYYTTACYSVSEGFDCQLDIDRSQINYQEDDEDQSIGDYVENTFWLVIGGVSQDCELHSIQYSFVVQTSFEVTFFPLDRTIANSVAYNEFNFHHLRPSECEYPQQSYLHIELFDLDVENYEQVTFYLKDNYIPTPNDYDAYATSTTDANGKEGSISLDWICGYENLYFSVYGDNVLDGDINYGMTVTKVPVPVKELFNNDVYAADDDDDDMCPHEHDFYIFKAVAPNGNFKTSFLRVSVESDYPAEVYVNKDSFAWKECNVASDRIYRSGEVDLYDFCDYSDGYYYITVVSNGPYYIYTNVVDNAKQLTLGSVFRDSLEAGQYQLYTLEICQEWYAPDDRLVIEIADINNGYYIQGWIQKDANPGRISNVENSFYYDDYCDIPNTEVFVSIYSGGYGFITLDHATLEPGTYHILLKADYANDDYDYYGFDDDSDANPLDVTFRIFPYLEDLEIDPTELEINTVVTGSVQFYLVDIATEGSIPQFQYYYVNPLTEGYENGIAFAQALIYDITGGYVSIGLMKNHLATFASGYISGDVVGLSSNYPLNYRTNMQSGRYPYTEQLIVNSYRSSPYDDNCFGSVDWCETTGPTASGPSAEVDSAAVLLSSCYFDLDYPHYIVVQAISQDYRDHPLSYSLEFAQYHDYVLLKPNTNVEANFTHAEHHYYRSLQAEIQSARWRVVVTQGEGVLVTVRNHRCPLQATWETELYCDADYFDRPWMCDIEIPTAAAHPGSNAFFIDVYGSNATYSLAYYRGLENCHKFDGAGHNEGLAFCAGLVPYDTWRWDDYFKLDSEAQCFFEDLYRQFSVQPCWSGVTTDCNTTLQRFACYESFHACDSQGFYVGTCRNACNAVVYECVNWFESVNLEHYNCTSSRYIDEEVYTCTGAGSFPSFNPAASNFFGKPDDILYNQEGHVYLQQDI